MDYREAMQKALNGYSIQNHLGNIITFQGGKWWGWDTINLKWHEADPFKASDTVYEIVNMPYVSNTEHKVTRLHHLNSLLRVQFTNPFTSTELAATAPFTVNELMCIDFALRQGWEVTGKK